MVTPPPQAAFEMRAHQARGPPTEGRTWGAVETGLNSELVRGRTTSVSTPKPPAPETKAPEGIRVTVRTPQEKEKKTAPAQGTSSLAQGTSDFPSVKKTSLFDDDVGMEEVPEDPPGKVPSASEKWTTPVVSPSPPSPAVTTPAVMGFTAPGSTLPSCFTGDGPDPVNAQNLVKTRQLVVQLRNKLQLTSKRTWKSQGLFSETRMTPNGVYANWGMTLRDSSLRHCPVSR